MEWQDINTAPKNGELVVISGTTGVQRFYEIARWDEETQFWVDYTGEFGVRDDLLTHWSPFKEIVTEH